MQTEKIAAFFYGDKGAAWDTFLCSGTCTGLEFDNLGSKFAYKVQLNSLSQQSCCGNVQ